MTVAVIGATGTAGPHVVDALLARRVETRVLTRDEAGPGAGADAATREGVG